MCSPTQLSTYLPTHTHTHTHTIIIIIIIHSIPPSYNICNFFLLLIPRKVEVSLLLLLLLRLQRSSGPHEPEKKSHKIVKRDQGTQTWINMLFSEGRGFHGSEESGKQMNHTKSFRSSAKTRQGSNKRIAAA